MTERKATASARRGRPPSVRKGAELVESLANRDPLLVAFREAEAEAAFNKSLEDEARSHRTDRDRHLRDLAGLERVAGAPRVRGVDRFSRLIGFVAGQGAVRTDARLPGVPEGTSPAVTGAIWETHQAADVSAWAAVASSSAVGRSALLELIRRLREHRIVYAEIAEFLRAADAKLHDRPGALVGAHVNADGSWRTHGPGGKRLLSDAIRQMISRARISVTAGR
jgi:hypothetical protein